MLLLLTHGEKVACVHAAGLIGHVHTHETESRAHAAAVLGCHLHGVSLCRRQVGRCQGRIAESSYALQFLNLLFVFFISFDTADTEGNKLGIYSFKH